MSDAQLAAARKDLVAVRRKRQLLADEAARLQRAAEETRRSKGDDHADTTAAFQALKGARDQLKEIRTKEHELRDLLPGHIGGVLPANPEEDLRKLSTDHPIVLLPVRIETVFGTDAAGRPELRLRIYPDEIHGDTHEAPLLEAERDAGKAYWQSVADGANERDAWRTLLARYPSPRAAWIVKQTDPSTGVNPPTRPQSWSRAAEARALPDRWIVLAYRGGAEVHRAFGPIIREPLALTTDPAAGPDETLDLSGDGMIVDHESAWTLDFERAEKVGMALRLKLKPADAAQGFDRLLVLGVKASISVKEAQARLTSLLDGHHYTRGLAFVRQGTPTNNTSAARAGFPPADPNGENSFAVERSPSLNQPEGNGLLFTRALGVDPLVTEHVEGAEIPEQKYAQAMNQVLWPCTLGYFLEHMLEPEFSAEQIRAARDYFVERVCGRGPLPVFRVGATPYGLLPVSSLARWRSAGNDERRPELTLRQLYPLWAQNMNNVPRVGRTGDPDQDLLETLGLDASTREVRIRSVLGPDFQRNLFNFLGINFTHWFDIHRSLGPQLLQRIGQPNWQARILEMTFADQSYLFRHPFVTQKPLSESETLDFNYIRWIRKASLAQLRVESLPNDVPRPQTLLYFLLRHAALTEYARIASDLLVRHALLTPLDRREAELIAIAPATATRKTAWERFDQKIAAVTGAETLGEFMLKRNTPDTVEVAAFRAALDVLADLPTAELERLLTETLDTCSHRLDAWITALPARRLEEMRQRQPLGSHLGAYGWVEELRPAPGRFRNVVLRDGRQLREHVTSGGSIHAPSMNHAAAAAILRNAWLTRAGADKSRFAIDLSSERVRQALWVLDSVREGQALGAVLGYQFERGLHEGHPPLQLDKYIAPLRKLYPLVANKKEASGEPTEAVAARSVVDGLRLVRAWKENAIPFVATPELPDTGNDRTAIEAELQKLEVCADAAADLLMAESVYQIIRGNTSASAASLDALAQGLRPPAPEVAEQPRNGTPLTHRVLAVLGGDELPEGPWAGLPLTPRAAAEPYLDRWAGRLLGDPAAVRVRASFKDPTPTDPENRTTIIITLSQLGLRPLDLLDLARGVTVQEQAGELDRRIAWVVQGVAPTATEVRIDYAADPAWDRAAIRTVPEILEAAQSINHVLSTARALRPEDLLPAEDPAASGADRMPGELATRAGDAVADLTASRDLLQASATTIEGTPADSSPDLTALRDGLRAAALLGVAGGFPATRTGSSPGLRAELLLIGKSVLAELNRRIKQAAELPAGADVDRMKAVFGRGFMVLPRFRPASAAELDLALAEGPALVVDPLNVRRWFQQAAHVHAPLGRWRKVGLYAKALVDERLDFEVVQLPHAAGARWAALPFADESQRPAARRLSLVLHRAHVPAATSPWVGFVLHEWTELIPSVSEQTAVAFHYDDPGAEAPQAVLLAVPPDPRPREWDLATLVDILHETLDLAKVRAVDGEFLGPLAQMIPAIFLAENPKADSISTLFSAMRMEEARIVGS